jgi:hypothetical protein
LTRLPHFGHLFNLPGCIAVPSTANNVLTYLLSLLWGYLASFHAWPGFPSDFVCTRRHRASVRA